MNRLSLIFFCITLSRVCYGEAEEEVTPTPLTRQLQVEEIEEYISTESGRDTLKAEFHSIKGGQRKPWTVASLPENLPKNRYNDLLAYDDTRVVLKQLPDDPFSDYINANYIDGYDKEKEYVATQGPLPTTINDFWRMVWQLNSTTIIMLANLIEHGESKVAKYWPDKDITYGDISVRKVSEFAISNASHVVRTFSISKILTPEHTRVVRQFHYTGWPDLGVPTDPLHVISLVLQARKHRGNDSVPLIIHCSAGVGRTGTIILTDSMIQKANAEGQVDYPKRLDHMRLQRVDVVEREAQYIFAHEAVYELLFGNSTAERLDDIDNQYNNMETQEDSS